MDPLDVMHGSQHSLQPAPIDIRHSELDLQAPPVGAHPELTHFRR